MPKNFITYLLTMILLGINAMYMLTQRCILFLKCSRSQDYNGTFNVHINSLSKRKNLTGWICRSYIVSHVDPGCQDTLASTALGGVLYTYT